MGGYLSKQWKTLPEKNKDNLAFVKSYDPHNREVKQLRILLHGPVGSGMSSFINSVDSVFQGRVTGRVMTDATFWKRVTEKYQTFRIRKDPESYYSFVFNDMMGFEGGTNCGVREADLELALRGHVKEGYKFNPKSQLTESDQDYNSSPTLEDRVHVLVYVVPADAVSLMDNDIVKKMRNVRLAASKLGIPQLAILTKADEACPRTQRNLKNIYWSKYLKKKADEFNFLLGLPLNCIFLVKNYHSELETNDATDAAILLALKQMLHSGEDFLNDL